MKKFFSIITMALFGLTAMTLTSCDEDQLTGMTLEGTWQGNMYEYNEWNGHTYWASSTEVEFVQDPFRFTSGSGYWVDTYSNAPWDYLAYHFTWTVRYGVIYIYFLEDGYEIAIYDYRLSDSYFTGYINGDKTMSFKLRHTYSPNWSNYGYGYDYWDYGYAKKAVMDEEGDSTTTIPQATTAKTLPKRGNAVRGI